MAALASRTDSFAPVLGRRRGLGLEPLSCVFSLRKRTDSTNCELTLDQVDLRLRNWSGRRGSEDHFDEVLVVPRARLPEAVRMVPTRSYRRTDLGLGASASAGCVMLNSGRGDHRQYRLYLGYEGRQVFCAFTAMQWHELQRALGIQAFS
jgi:hypothetical protein